MNQSYEKRENREEIHRKTLTKHRKTVKLNPVSRRRQQVPYGISKYACRGWTFLYENLVSWKALALQDFLF